MPQRSTAIDAVRGVAILLVVAYHCAGLPGGWTGVDLFFVLSGYLIGGLLIDNRSSRSYYTTFYARRFLRIVPLYAIFLFAVGVTTGLGLPLWRYLTFTQNFAWNANGLLGAGPTGLTWSLAVEEQFYLLLPPLIRILPARGVPVLAIGCVVAAPFCRLAMQAAGSQHAPYLMLPGRMDDLFAGVFVAWLVRQPTAWTLVRRHVRTAVTVGAGAVLLFAMIALPSGFSPIAVPVALYGYSLMALAYACALVVVLTMPEIASRQTLLAAVGVGAYSIYLFHQLVLGQILSASGIATSGPAQSVLFPIATAVIALFTWHGVERPCIAFARGRWRYDRVMAWSEQ